MKQKKTALLTAAVLTALCVFGTLPAPSVSAAGTQLYVGYADKENNYRTVNEAVRAAEQLNPTSEQTRVTIHIAPGTYREQITINTPYLSFVNDNPSQQVLLTWYYGIGYKYYSVGSNGEYSADAAAARTAKNEPKVRWGCSVRLRSNADWFHAENITFENSFNRYVTEEELADGVEVSGSQSITFQRYRGADVQSKAATERAAALAIEGDYAEFQNCAFHSSQDTLYLGASFGYFKNCLIEGNTDYIFGSGTYVFDTCELRFKGYSNNAVGGYITANKDAGRTLFWNCSVTAAAGRSVSAGYFGRPWGASADVAFVNTNLQYEGIITSAGWTKMSDHAPENAKFKEYGTTAGGRPVNTSGRVSGTVRYSADGLDMQTYLGSWTPFYLNGGVFVPLPSIDGKLVRELTPQHSGYEWKIRETTQTGDLLYSDRTFVFDVLPDALAGGEAILTPCDGKKLSGTLAVCNAAEDITVSVLLDTRVEKLPAWLSDWTKTGAQAVNSDAITYDVYAKDFAKDAEIVLGENGQSAYCTNYTVIVTKTPAAATLRGDTDCNGVLNGKDLTVLKQYLLSGSLTDKTALANADCNGDGSIDHSDLMLLRDFLLGASM